MNPKSLTLMGAASPDLEKQGFLAVVFVYREYSKQQETASENYPSPKASTPLSLTIV